MCVAGGGDQDEAPKVPRTNAVSARGWKMGRGYPLPIRPGGLGSVVGSPIWVRGVDTAENKFREFYLLPIEPFW